MACSDLMYKKNPGGTLVRLPPLPVAGGYSQKFIRFYSYLREDTSNPFRDCLLQREMLEEMPRLSFINMLQALNVFPHVTNRLVLYEARHTGENREIFNARALCLLVCYAMRYRMTANRIMSVQMVKFLNAWMNTPFAFLGDTYATHQGFLDHFFSPAVAGWEGRTDSMFCNLEY